MTVFADKIVPKYPTWDTICENFRWPELDRFNIATACIERWARQDPNRTALICPNENKDDTYVSFGQLNQMANQFANVLKGLGHSKGDRCAILLPQSLEAAVSHFGVYKTAGVALPMFTLFGSDALEFRLKDSAARAVVTDAANLPKVLAIVDNLPHLNTIFCVDGGTGKTRDFHSDLASARDVYRTVGTAADDPALLVYTSGTTGPPKGALHAHRVLIGHLPCIETSHNFFPQVNDVAWTPADWAWMGGLMNMMLPSLYYGVPVVAHRMGKFDPLKAYALMEKYAVRNSFLPPTALKLMRQVPAPKTTPLRSVASGGEALGADTFEWAQQDLNLTINEIYGQTECNLVLGNCVEVFEPVPGSMGRENPGARVDVLDEKGAVLGANSVGEIAIHKSHKAMFLEYWQAPEKTKSKFIGDWLLTGDIGRKDENGFFHFSSRDDDIISSGGYRIGPSEVESCLTSHKDVVLAAVIGVPDPIRGEAVKAFVVLHEAAKADGIEQDLINLVKARISPHVAPKFVEVVADLPLTATGKIMRRELRGA